MSIPAPFARIPAPPPSLSAFAERTPPYSAEAELAVLGGMMLDADALSKAIEVVDDTMFYREGNRRIFRAMVRIFERGEVIDFVTLPETLRAAGDLESAGGLAFLSGLMDAVPTAANIEYHAKIVREKALLRRLIEAATTIIQDTYAGQNEVEELLDEAEQRIFQIAQTHDRKGFVWIKEILWPTFEKIEQLQNNTSSVTGVPTGFADLDELTAGFQPGDLIIVAARPSMGKCLAAGSEILLDDGSVVTIEELGRRRAGRLLTLGDGMKLGMTEPSAFFDDGEKPVFRVTTRLGRTVDTTLTHPFLTIDGWKPLGEISVGDHVAVPRRLDVFGDAAMRESEVRLLGYLTGGRDLTDAPPSVRADFADALTRFGAAEPFGDTAAAPFQMEFACGGGKMVTAPQALARSWARRKPLAPAVPLAGEVAPERSSALTAWMARVGLVERGAGAQAIPGAVFTLPRAGMALFINRLFAVGGWASVPAVGPARVGYATTSERLIRQVQHLLLRFGVIARVREEAVKYRDGRRASWRLDVTDAASIGIFAREIGILGKEDELSPAISHEPRDSAESDVCWDAVVSIEPIGMRQVYDLTIPGTHNFVANDVCVHNTAFTLNIAQHAAISAKSPVAFFSLEMSKESLVQRVLCAEARVDNSRLRRGRLQDDEYARLATAAGYLNTAPIYIDDSAGISILEMRAKARRLKSDRPDLAMIIVDYLQLMVGKGKTENRQQEVSEISRGLKALAKELNVPVVALSQLSRAVEQRPDKRPMMSDLRECVTGETLVVLADGRRVPIRDLVGTEPEVVSVSPEGRLIQARSDLVWPVGVKPVLRVRLASGRTIRCTAEHRLLGGGGWTHAGELAPGDRLAIARLAGAELNTNVHAAPMETSGRAMASARGTSYGGGAHFAFAPSRATVAEYAELLDDDVLREQSASDLLWDRVVEVAPDGEEEVFDLTVPGPASWLADGIVSHNSGAIEQDADVIMFLYRPEYYFGPVDKEGNSIEGRAELIIGKQRNGATGKVDLMFLKEFTRFESFTGRPSESSYE